MTITTNQIERVQNDWTSIAKENVRVEFISGTFYGFCSELAALRLAVKYTKSLADGTAKADYSENLKSWFFRLETSL